MTAGRTIYTISPSPDSALAVEVTQGGWSKRKHLFIFERFTGALVYDPAQPLDSELSLAIDAASLVCRTALEKAKKQERLGRSARETALEAHKHPEVRIRSQCFSSKPLRGFNVDLVLSLRGVDRTIRANIGFGTEKKNRLRIDADASARLSQFAITPPASLLGLIRTHDEIMLHALLWGTPAT